MPLAYLSSTTLFKTNLNLGQTDSNHNTDQRPSTFPSFGIFLGLAGPTSFFSASDCATTENDGKFWFYPQSLVKQTEYDDNVGLSSVDIIASFNSDAPFYFEVYH